MTDIFSNPEAVQAAIDRWSVGDQSYAHGDITTLLAEINRLRGERQGWVDTAAEFARNMEYYRGLVDRIGRAIGPEAYTAADGSKSEDVLRAKVPEIIERRLSGEPT